MTAGDAEKYQAELEGSGAIAQGDDTTAVGERGVFVKGATAPVRVNTGDTVVISKQPRQPYTPPPLPDPDTLPAHGTLPPGSYLPHERNPLFTGREPQLKKLARALLYAPQGDVIVSQRQTAVASGLGGIGKTQLAVEFAHRYGQFFEGGVYWLNCENAQGIPGEVALVGGEKGMGLYRVVERLTLEEQVGMVQRAWQEDTPRLLIFDNCEEEVILKKWRPVSGGCRVLVTSRRGTWARTLGVQPLPLDVLERPESIALLRQFLPNMAEQEANDIASELGDLPLALHLAGSYLAAYAEVVTPAAYLEKLRDEDLLNHPSLQGRGAEPSPTGHDLHVARTFALSFERLDPQDETDQAALFLLACAACFAPGEAIPGDWLTAALESDDELLPLDGLRRLVALGLLATEGKGGYQLHRLLAVYVRQRLTARMDEARMAVEQVVAWQVHELNMAGYPAALLPWQSQIRHVTEAAVQRGSELAATLLNNLGSHLQDQGDLAAVQPLFERALVITEQALGSNHPGTAISLNNLARLRQDQGDLAAARPLLERALSIYESTLGPDHPLTAISLNNLGGLLQDMGDLAAVQPLFERALAICEQALGPDHPDTAISLNNLGMLLKDLGDWAAAQPLLERALAICEQMLGPGHPLTAKSLNNLATLLSVIGDLAAARPLFERALAIREQALQSNHPDTAISLNNLGRLLQEMGDLAAAQPFLERALAICEQALGPDHPDTANSLNSLGMLLQDLGDQAAARSLYERALAIREQALVPNHPDTANSLNNLGMLLQEMGDLAAARPLLERALAIREQTLGPNHPDTANSLNNLAGLLRDMGDYAAARLLIERVLAIREQVLGPDHPDTATSLNNLATLLCTMGNFAEARLLLERALAIKEQTLGPDHPGTRIVRDNLAIFD